MPCQPRGGRGLEQARHAARGDVAVPRVVFGGVDLCWDQGLNVEVGRFVLGGDGPPADARRARAPERRDQRGLVACVVG